MTTQTQPDSFLPERGDPAALTLPGANNAGGSKMIGVWILIFVIAMIAVFMHTKNQIEDEEMLKAFYGFTAITAIALCCFFFYYRKHVIINDTPVSKVKGVFIGRVALEGMSRCKKFIYGYLSDTPCVWTEYRVQEHYRRVTYEKDTDGKMQKKVTEGWETIESETNHVPFVLEDDTGMIAVYPKNATVHGDTVFDKTVTPFNELYWGKCQQPEIDGSTHSRRFTEDAVPIDAAIYIFGFAQIDEKNIRPYIAWHKTLPLYEIATGTKQTTSTLYLWISRGCLAITAVLIAVFCYYGNDRGDMTGGIGTGILAVLFFCLGWLWLTYNRLTSVRQRVLEGYAQLDVQYKRRADLIPNLVEVVKAYAAHEASTQQAVTELRNMAATRRPPSTVNSAEAGTRIVALAEAYPELKANQNFLRLQGELADTETRIALAANYYNDFATSSNTLLMIFPTSFVARLTMLKRFPLIGLGNAPEQRAPQNIGDAFAAHENAPPQTEPAVDETSPIT